MLIDDSTPDETTLFRDYRGVACPMNFARITVDLMDLQIGDTLKVLIDNGEPAVNVPRSLIREGQKVLKQTDLGTYCSLIIQKIVD